MIFSFHGTSVKYNLKREICFVFFFNNVYTTYIMLVHFIYYKLKIHMGYGTLVKAFFNLNRVYFNI